MTESDGIRESLDGQLRIAITVAGQVGEYIARVRESGLRRAQAAGEHEARELTARLDAERAAARAELAAVKDDAWWTYANNTDIAHTWQVARAWAGEDPEARAAAEQIRTQVRLRYGIDVENTGTNPADVQAALDQALADQQNANAERGRAAAEDTEAALLMRQADAEEWRAEQAGPDAEQTHLAAEGAREDANVVYDSAERRQRLANDLEARGIASDVADTHVRADVSQATPPTAATTPPTSAKARHRQVQHPHRRPELAR